MRCSGSRLVHAAALAGALLTASATQADVRLPRAQAEVEAGGSAGFGIGSAMRRMSEDVVAVEPVHTVASLHLAARVPVGEYVSPGLRLELATLWSAAEAEARLFPWTHDVGWWLGCHAGVAAVPQPTQTGKQYSGPWRLAPILGLSVGKTWLPAEVFAITLDLNYRALLLKQSGYDFSAIDTVALDGVQQDVKLGLSVAFVIVN